MVVWVGVPLIVVDSPAQMGGQAVTTGSGLAETMVAAATNTRERAEKKGRIAERFRD